MYTRTNRVITRIGSVAWTARRTCLYTLLFFETFVYTLLVASHRPVLPTEHVLGPSPKSNLVTVFLLGIASMHQGDMHVIEKLKCDVASFLQIWYNFAFDRAQAPQMEHRKVVLVDQMNCALYAEADE